MEKLFAPEETRELIRGWIVHARKGWKKQEKAARRLESQYRSMGVASVILSAIVGASLFSSLEAEYAPWGRIVAGFVSVAASVLASLVTFHRFEERTERHRSAGVGFKTALRELEKLHVAHSVSTPGPDSIDRIQQELGDLGKIEPVVPEDINRAVEKDFRVYRFVPKAEDLRAEGKARSRDGSRSPERNGGTVTAI